MKLQVQLDLRHGALDAVSIEAGKDCDQRTPLQSAPMPEGGLRITDLGYFDTQGVSGPARGRRASGSRAWPSAPRSCTPEGTPITRIDDLFAPATRVVDRPVLLGKQAKLPCRIVIWRVPQEVANRRRQKLIATARDKGGPMPSRERLAWCDGTIFVTNVPSDLLSPEEIGGAVPRPVAD